MKNRLILFNVIVTAAALLAFFGFGILVTESQYYRQAEEKIADVAEIYRMSYRDAGETVKMSTGNIRVTVIGSDGNVIADSESVDVTSLGNHLDREEIKAALDGQPKAVRRKSDTLGRSMVYYAVKADTADGYVFIRVSVPVDSVNGYVIGSLPLMIYVLCGALLCSLFASAAVGNSVLKPLRMINANLREVRDGTYKPVVPSANDDEINNMLIDINGISEKLSETIKSSNDDRERLGYILNNVSDGIAVLDRSGNITMMNKNASDVFRISGAEGQNYRVLTADPGLTDAISGCLSDNTDSVTEYSDDRGSTYLVSVRSLERGFVIIVLSDITAVKNSEHERSEFFANASHELKTPLTAVKGFNDMIMLKSSDDTVRDFSARVDREVNRMIGLINDMLDLSRLEENRKPDRVPVDLRNVADEVAETLMPLASEKHIDLTVTGNASVMAEKEHMTELIKNLAENGIRYNNAGGSVRVTLSDTADGAVIDVRDNGIGIEE
ncbi:MAG: histidine kinase dimerization/phospho-acceptor domain-containing protein, partial [Eubacteriales bacterium]|nr:histidine kinase dimerization/phospho-acceptor domain-containing protein [Eubacteriales bacterium]